MIRILTSGLAALLLFSGSMEADTPPTAGEATPMARELDVIREDLVALEIEKALAAIAALLERSDLSDATRVAALDLRAQAHVASDDLADAEKDYRALLELSPGYEPGRDVTSKKAMERFLKIRSAMIGTVRIDLDPKDAVITVDGRPVVVPADGVFPVLAGERHVHATRKGFDTQDVDAHVVAGKETGIKLQLLPNARSLVVRTDIDGVAVTLDGVASGLTGSGGGAGADKEGTATLIIEDVPVGEHELRFSKLCYATESSQEVVSVDLADRSPKIARVVPMRPARTRVNVTGARYDGELMVDGARVAALPLTTFETCPGVRTVEVVSSGRTVWSGVVDAQDSDLSLDLAPRPSVVTVGAEGSKAWAATFSEWSQRDRVAPPPGADLTVREGWRGVALPPGTDLAVGVIPRAGVADEDRVVLYGPALHEVEERPSPPRASRPSWSVPTLGVVLVDGYRGAVLVAAVSAKGPAAGAGLLPGDRVISIAGRAVVSAASARDVIAGSEIGSKLELEIAAPSGTTRKVECVTSSTPDLSPPRSIEDSPIVRAAWASVEGAAGGPNATIALAHLAILLERSGRYDDALDIWRRVRAMPGGRLAARAAYAVGAGLQSTGRSADAIEALRQARTLALAENDEALAAAAGDRLADLGVAPR